MPVLGLQPWQMAVDLFAYIFICSRTIFYNFWRKGKYGIIWIYGLSFNTDWRYDTLMDRIRFNCKAPAYILITISLRVLYARLKNGRFMQWQWTSVRPSFPGFFQHAFRYQFETWVIHSVGGTTYQVWVSSQLDHLTYFTAKISSNFFSIMSSEIKINPSNI